jgi:CRS1 / YhbY (CRM) domain.
MLIRQLQEALEARELIKISILQNATEDKEKIAGQLANGTGAEIVQTIGRTVVLYKESQKKKTIELP